MKSKLLISILLFAFVSLAFADIQKLVQETQRMDIQNDKLKMLWWIPNEYWEVSLKNNPRMTENGVKEFITVVDKYTIVAVIDGEIGPLAAITAKSHADISKEIILQVNNQKYRPIPKSKLSPEITNFFTVMKPMMAGMLGKFGEGMEFIAFDGKTTSGERLLDPGKDMQFTLTLGKSYHYRLPLGSLLPDKIDPDTRETFPGNYIYNPFTGHKLK